MISDKVRPHHLERKAILYVRQSSAHQVLHNRESSALQYAMRDRLTALGWSEIEVIDDDLGRSAAGGVQRAGFERMVAEVYRAGFYYPLDGSRAFVPVSPPSHPSIKGRNTTVWGDDVARREIGKLARMLAVIFAPADWRPTRRRLAANSQPDYAKTSVSSTVA